MSTYDKFSWDTSEDASTYWNSLPGMEEGSQREKRRICGASSRVGLVFCGRQSPGGHNVVWGLHEALKIHNPKSTLLGFLGGSEGLFAQKTLEITDDVLATYKNQGGYDLLGRTKDQIRTTKKVNFGMAACKALKLDGLVIVGGVTSNTDAAQLAETFAEAKSATKVVGVPVTLNGDLKNQFVEANVGFDTICKLNAEARHILVDSYVALRKGDIAPGSRNAYHMKIRQLEALIRLSEAITRCHPDDEVHPRHVRLATRLLKISVISVESTEIDLTEFQDDIQEDSQEDGDIGGNGESQPSGADAKLTNEYPENAEVAAKKLVITDEYFQRVTQAERKEQLQLHGGGKG